MANNVSITPGTGATSIAAETVSGISYQQIEVYGGGGASVLSVNPDGSFKASIIGTPAVTFSGSPSISGAVTIVGTPSISGAVTIVGTPSISGTVNIGNIVSTSVQGAVQIAGSSPSSIASVQRLDVQLSGSTLGVAAQVVIHGQTGRGTGAYVDVGADSGTGAILTSVVGLQGASVSGTVGASIIGQLPAGTAPIGSVATLQATNPWVIVGSVYGSGSVVGFQGGSWTISGSVLGYQAPLASLVSGISSVITSTSQTSVLAKAPGGQKNYINTILVTNQQTSVTGAGTQVNIIDDGSGVVMWSGYAAAGGGGFANSFPTPLAQPTSTFSISAKASSQASILVGISGFTA